MFKKLVMLALLAGLGLPALGQRTTGSISGTVKDATGAALPGVTVSVSGPNIVGTQTATTNEQGFYRVLNLPPGEYQISYSLSGFKTVVRKNARVGLGTNLEENPSLEVSQLEESIDVVGEASVIDTTSNEVGTNYDRSFVENAPLRRLSFFDLVAAAPGSLQAGDNGFRAQRTMVYGSSYDENSFQLDGVDITETYFNEALAEPNVDAIEEVEVLSLGAPAEYGNMSGAVYNIVTRQGTNEFHGDLNYFHQSDGLTSSNTEDLKNPDGTFYDACPTDSSLRCPFARDEYKDFTAQLGGPIIKDKLWFFGSFQYQRDTFAEAGTDTSNPLSYRSRRSDRYMGKINWQVNPHHKIVANFHYDRREDDYGISSTQAPTEAFTRYGTTPTPGIAYTGVLSDKTVLDVRYSGFFGHVWGGPTDPDQPRDLDRFYDFDTGTTSGGWYYWYDTDPTKRQTATAKISHLADNFLGSSHDFKFGVQYTDAVAKGLYGYNDFVYTYTYYGTRYGYGYERQPFSYSGHARSLGVFLDDTVRVNDRVSFNLGLRYDHNKAFSDEQDELDEFARPTGTTYPRVDLFTWNHFSPRLGFNLKLTKDGRTVLKGHWGRYHRAIATGEYANVIPQREAHVRGIGLRLHDRGVHRSQLLRGQREPGRRSGLQGAVYGPVHPEPRARAGPGPGRPAQLRPQEGTGLRHLEGHHRRVRPRALHRRPRREPDRTDLRRLPPRERSRRAPVPHHERRGGVQRRRRGEPVALQEDERQLADERIGDVAAGRGSRQRQPGGRRGPAARRPAVRGLRQEPQRLREHRRPAAPGRDLDGQAAARLSAPVGLADLGQHRPPQRRVVGASRPRPGLRHERSGGEHHPAATPRRERPAPRRHPGRHADREGFQVRREPEARRVRRRAQPAERRRPRDRPEHPGHLGRVQLAAEHRVPAPVHGGRQVPVLIRRGTAGVNPAVPPLNAARAQRASRARG